MKLLKGFKLKDNTKKLNKYDWIIMGIMVLLYGILSFIRLGDTKVPVTYRTFENEDDYEIVELQDDSYIRRIRYYTGNDLGQIKVLSSRDGKEYQEVTSIKIDSVFTWQDVEVETHARFIKFEAEIGGSTLGDVAFYGYLDMIPIIVDEKNPLTDEIDLVPENIDYMNSTYFDEIYYARSAYEYANGMDAYEWSHPPLGKLIITIPVALFGFSPFNYRLMANIFGILMIPLMYIIGKRIFKSRKWALLAALIMMFDSFHFAHTRIALVDGFQVFFILLSFLFMKEYMDLSKNSEFKKKALYLILSGTFIGCAIATKWNALYVGLGLAITFFVHLFKQYKFKPIEFFKKNIKLDKIVRYISILTVVPLCLYYLLFLIINKNVAKVLVIIYFIGIGLLLFTKIFYFIFKDKYLTKLFFTCILSFIIIPVVIYILSYILFPTVSYYDHTLGGIIDVNKMMYDYHANLDATHPFSSVWYEWPIMAKPVWFYSGSSLDGLRMTITDIGNPIIWWTGVVSFVYLVISSIKKKDSNNIFLLIFILSTFIPYVFIGRLMFMYHYFITLPFIMLGIVSFMKWITENLKNDKVYYGYIILIAIIFIIFYPIVSGMPISGDYVNSLRWLPGWYF